MTAVRFTDFGGMIPRLGARNLPPNAARTAYNVKLTSGELRPLQAPLLLSSITPSTPVTVFHFEYDNGDYFMAFDEQTWVVQSPLLNDSFNRLFWANSTGVWENTKPRIIAGDPPYKVGVPAPVGTLTGSTTGGTVALAETRVYAATFSTGFAEQGPPGTSLTLTGNADGTWTIDDLDTLTTPPGTWDNLALVSLYRTITTPTGVDFRLVDSWAYGSAPATYNDTVTNETLASRSLLESYSWEPPPDGLTGIIAASGFLVGFVGRQMYASEAFRPWAWPTEYQVGVEDEVVALGAYGNNVVIATTGNPYVVTGSTPDAISLSKIKSVLPCLSSRSLVSTVASVIYASENGLVSVSDSGVDIISKSHITRDEWLAAFSPESLNAAVYEDRYLAMYSPTQGFIMGFDDPMTALSYITMDNVSSVDTSALTGQAILGMGDSVYAFDNNVDEVVQYTWRSKVVLVPKPINMAAVQIRADYYTEQTIPIPPPPISENQSSNFNATLFNDAIFNMNPLVVAPVVAPAVSGLVYHPVTIKVYGDSILRYTAVIGTEDTYRMPAGYKAAQWQIEISGSAPVYSVVMAETAKELEVIP